MKIDLSGRLVVSLRETNGDYNRGERTTYEPSLEWHAGEGWEDVYTLWVGKPVQHTEHDDAFGYYGEEAQKAAEEYVAKVLCSLFDNDAEWIQEDSSHRYYFSYKGSD